MSNTGDSASVTRRWIDDNVALFVVIVVAGALLVVALVTLAIYCCCCRRKTDHWKRGRGESKANDSYPTQAGDPRGDSVDADSAVTATMRGPGLVEIQVETSHHQPMQQSSQYELEVSSQRELVDNQHKEAVSVQDVRMYMQQEDRPRDLELQQMSQVTPEVVRIEMAPMTETKPMRLPRTEVSVVAEVQSPQRVVEVPALRKTDKDLRGSRGHGVSIYQSADNEITIVDSDFSDYEDSAGDAAARKRDRTAAGRAGENTASWETLPNTAVQSAKVPSSNTLHVEEPPVFAVDRLGQEYIPVPSPSREEMRLRQAKNLAELDVTLSVFEQQAEEGSPAAGSPQVEAGVVNGYVDEELVMAVDRSEVWH